MIKILLVLGGLFIFGCTPTVKKVAIYKNKPDVVVVKKGHFYFSEEDRKLIRRESKKLGMRIPDSEEIRKHLRLFLRDKRSLETALRRANLYAPYIKPILRKYGLPEELALLPLIESGFNPFAVSRSGAGGLWQLMPQTAKRYGLRVGGSVDERFDLYRSTEAAARYLKDLYRMFGNWELVLAAYNCGEGCVRRRTGGADFWKSKWALPDQTRKYVPMFFAALLIAYSPERYGLNVELENLRIGKRYVSKGVGVREFVRTVSLKESTFRDLNPHIRGDYIPSGVFVYVPEREKPKTASVRKKGTKIARRLENTHTRTGSIKKTHSERTNLKTKKVPKRESKVAKANRKIEVKPVRKTPIKVARGKVSEQRELKEVHEIRRREGSRIIIKVSGNPLKGTKVLRLENGAVVYIKD